MTKQTEALKLALEALEYIDLVDNDRDFLQPHECYMVDKAITALREALAEQPAIKQDLTPEQPAQQEPVGEAYLCDKCQTPFDGNYYCPECGHNTATKESVYTSPPASKPWVGLVWGELPEDGHNHDFLRGAAWAESKLREKNA